MAHPIPVPPESDRALGLEFYVTETPGVTLTIKGEPEDFLVREISAYPFPDADGRFTVLRVESRDWEQHELVRALARQLNVRPSQIRWAGTKDRRAVAERLLSYPGPLPTVDVRLRGVRVLEAYRARGGLALGHHYGNSFEILAEIADPRETAGADLQATMLALKARGGFANLFGPQRFGEVRPVTHLVGRAVVGGSVEEAVETYLAFCPDGPPSLGEEARKAYATHHDPQRALREFPPSFRFERVLLDHLAQGHDAKRAFRALPHPLRSLFVHAFQAWLFNRWVSGRAQRGLDLEHPVPGDYLLRSARDGTIPGTDPVAVSDDNLEECTAWVERGRAHLAGPLVGVQTPVLEGTPGEILEELLSEATVKRTDFAIPASPDIASEGSWRPLWCPLPPVAYETVAAGAGRPAHVRMTFALPKGTYATVLLREFTKGTTAPGRIPLDSNRVY